MDSGSNPPISEMARELPLGLLDPNPWNPNRMGPANYARLKRELARGFLAPLLVRPRGNRFQIIDGEHRFRLARELGCRAVPCVVATLSDQEARLKTLQMNGLRGENAPDLDPVAIAGQYARAGAEAKKIVAGFKLPPVTRELYVAVLPLGGRAEVEAAVAAARLREREENDGAALVALCRWYRERGNSPQRRRGAEGEQKK